MKNQAYLNNFKPGKIRATTVIKHVQQKARPYDLVSLMFTKEKHLFMCECNYIAQQSLDRIAVSNIRDF